MGTAAQLAGAVSKLLARLHRWYGTAWVLSRVPLASLNNTSMGRLRYALMMANRTQPMQTQHLLHGLLRRAEPVSPGLRIELAGMATAVGLPRLAADLLLQSQQDAGDPATRDAAGKLLQLLCAEADGTLQASLQDRIRALAVPLGQLPLTLVPVSEKYLGLWRLWLQQVRRHVGGHVVAMAMDDAAHAAVAGQQDIAVVDVRAYFSWDAAGRLHPHTRGVLWYLRVLLLQALVRQGHTVLVLDLDAVPVGDVPAMLAAWPHADVIAQKDHSIPMDVDRQLGFVLCCGFMLWRPTAVSANLLQRFAAETAVERDDQLALNHLLAREGIAKKTTDGSGLRFQSVGAGFVCPAATQVSRALNSGSVVRHFHQTGQSIAELQSALEL